MRLYSTSDATQVDDPEFGTFKAGKNGAFDFPDGLSERLHRVHVGKKAQWETDNERVKRIANEELESVRDPATLLAAVKDIGSNQNVLVAALAKMLGVDTAGAQQATAAGRSAEGGAERSSSAASDADAASRAESEQGGAKKQQARK